MMLSSPRGHLKVTAILVAFVFAATGAELTGQTTDPNTPASSPLWWTLTDEISPRELRDSFRDRKANLERYMEALEKGYAAPHPPEQLEYLSYFHAGALHAELLPMWEAFVAFEVQLRSSDGRGGAAPEALRGHGISPAGVEIILAKAHEGLASEERLSLEIRDDQAEFMRLSRKAAEVLGDQPVRIAMKNRRAEVIARATNQPLAQVEKLMSSWEIDPAAATMEDVLPQLREALDAADWEGLRRYLLLEVAPQTSAIDFDYSEKVQ